MDEEGSGRWLRLYVKTMDSACAKSSEVLSLWIWLLLLAKDAERPAGQERKVLWLRGERPLGRGQISITHSDLAKKLRCSRSSIQRRLEKLEQIGNLRTESGPHFSIVTISHWLEYQPEWKEPGRSAGTKRAASGPQAGTLRLSENLRIGLKEHTPSEPAVPRRPRLKAYPELPGFLDWYQSAYPRPVKRPDACKAWHQTNAEASQIEIVAGTERWVRFWAESGTPPDKIPYPATFLRAEQWRNDPIGKKLQASQVSVVTNHCACGHPKAYHQPDQCLGAGCSCKSYQREVVSA